jgi:hypothetical protein
VPSGTFSAAGGVRSPLYTLRGPPRLG